MRDTPQVISEERQFDPLTPESETFFLLIFNPGQEKVSSKIPGLKKVIVLVFQLQICFTVVLEDLFVCILVYEREKESSRQSSLFACFPVFACLILFVARIFITILHADKKTWSFATLILFVFLVFWQISDFHVPQLFFRFIILNLISLNIFHNACNENMLSVSIFVRVMLISSLFVRIAYPKKFEL